ncbi:MAG: helix-turn-helix domain-containing protein [Porticoccaceae bacterium]|nr:TetR/AcrR family transcriptional regulator [Pseudomonadales bacterium]
MAQQSRAINVHLGQELKSNWAEYCAKIGKTPGVAIKEAVELLLETSPHPPLEQQDPPIDSEPKTRIQALVTPSEKKAIAARARLTRLSQQEWIREAIKEHLQQTETFTSKNEQKLTHKRQPKRANEPDSPIENKLLMAMESLIERNRNFGSVTVEELSKEAGIARATFYLHFSDKAELVAKLMQHLTKDVVDSAGTWFEKSQNPAGNINIRSTVSGIFKTFKKHHAILEAITHTSKYDQNVARLHQQMMDQLCAQSRHAIYKNTGGKLPEGVSYDILADVLTRVIEMYCAEYISDYDDEQLERLIDTFSHICHQAIFSTAP